MRCASSGFHNADEHRPVSKHESPCSPWSAVSDLYQHDSLRSSRLSSHVWEIIPYTFISERTAPGGEIAHSKFLIGSDVLLRRRFTGNRRVCVDWGLSVHSLAGVGVGDLP